MSEKNYLIYKITKSLLIFKKIIKYRKYFVSLRKYEYEIMRDRKKKKKKRKKTKKKKKKETRQNQEKKNVRSKRVYRLIYDV